MTTTQNIYNMTDTWTDGSTYTAIKMNVTDTSSNAASLLEDLQVGGTSQFSVSKAGVVNVPNTGANGATGYATAGIVMLSQVSSSTAIRALDSNGGIAFVANGGTTPSSFWGQLNASKFSVGSGVVLGWANATSDLSVIDTTLQRNSAGIIGVNNGQTTNIGILPGVQIATTQVVTSLLNNNTNPQNVFASANDVLSLAATTTYFFDCLYFINTGGTTHTTATGFVASSAFTSINYLAELWSTTAGTISTTAPSVLDVGVSTATVLNATSTATRTTIRCNGIIRTNGATTVTPQITFSAGPTGTCEVAVNSYFRIWPVGSNTVAAVGNWA